MPPPFPFSTATSCLRAAETIQRGLQPAVRVSLCVPTLTSTSCLSLPPRGQRELCDGVLSACGAVLAPEKGSLAGGRTGAVPAH